MITLRQFEVFAAVVRDGSFRRSAAKLGVSQVSISEHVRMLERRLGVELFDRQPGKAPTLTEKGVRTHRQIVEILAAVDDLVASTGNTGPSQAQQINLAVHSFLMRDLPAKLAQFRAAHPEIELRADSALHSQEEILQLVAARKLDLAWFFALDDVPNTQFVRNERLAVFVGKDHPLASAATVTAEQLAACPAIQLTDHDPLHALVNRALISIGLQNRAIGVETDDFGLILGTVQRCYGYACMFENTFAQEEASFGLVQLKMDRQLPPLQVRLARRPMAQSDPLLTELAELLARTWQANEPGVTPQPAGD